MTHSSAHPASVAKRMSCADIAQRIAAQLDGPGEVVISGINAMHEAGPADITFITDNNHAGKWSD
ncbi:MAG TPA: hypothetical protein VG711_05805, partial [Phycisphaerales bacterium]|nr:hypothetical protein [Phycisphaerales bacterium]